MTIRAYRGFSIQNFLNTPIFKNTNERRNLMEENIRINEKFLLTLKEAALYSNIGINRLRDITNQDGCDFVIWSGNKRLIKRKAFEEYLTAAYSA